MPTTVVEPAPAPTDRRRGARFGVGVALLMAGLALLGYLAWQVFGTNVVSQHEQKQLVERTQKLWAKPPAAASVEGRDGGSRPQPDRAQALVRIPALGRDYLVPVQDGVSDDVLATGLGHFAGTAAPGGVGNFALAGHRVTHGEPLRDLPSLRPGDTILVETRTRVYTYRLDTDPNDLIVSFEDVWVIDELPRNPRGGVEPSQRPGERLLTLTTCAELFHTDDRMIAFGHLVGSRVR